MRLSRLTIGIAAAVLTILAVTNMAQTERIIRAPEFPKGADWLNSKPLTMESLRGKIVLLDFWTYACINCMHIIPDLKRLEEKYPSELVVIGVHSAKFDNEKDTENIRQAVLKYGVKHPVINDKDFRLWYEYGVRAWPTLVLIDPDGKVASTVSGEDIYDFFDGRIAQLIKEYDGRGLIDRTALKPVLEQRTQDHILSFPGKIAADEQSKRLFFTDSNNNRVLVTTLEGQILERIGDGGVGLVDGDFSTAEFFHPQGIAFDSEKNCVYVADTENHAVRKIDLTTRRVSTIAGNGMQARFSAAGGKGSEISLNSPWDVMLMGDTLYIAMAGPHQLWSLELKTGRAKVFAGSGREGIIDGPFESAALAQPSGITRDGMQLYFADSEASAVRVADLSDGRIKTLIGVGLFDFGDVDDRYPKARLQHPLGVAFHDGYVYVADTYNHKIKRVDPATRQLVTLIGTGRRGYKDAKGVEAELNEPNGLAFAGEKMYVTDTNNHLIRVFDVTSGMVSTLPITQTGMKVMAGDGEPAYRGRIKRLPAAEISPSTKELRLRLRLPQGMKINEKAPFRVAVSSDMPGVVTVKKSKINSPSTNLRVPISAKAGHASLTVDLHLSYCEKTNEGLCYFDEARLEIPVAVSAGGAKEFVAEYEVGE